MAGRAWCWRQKIIAAMMKVSAYTFFLFYFCVHFICIAVTRRTEGSVIIPPEHASEDNGYIDN